MIALDAVRDRRTIFSFVGSNVHAGGTVWRFDAPRDLAGPSITPSVVATASWTAPTRRLSVSGGTLFILQSGDPTNIPRFVSSTTLSSTSVPGLIMTTRSDIPGATATFANGIAYVK